MDELDKLNWIKDDVSAMGFDLKEMNEKGDPYRSMKDMARINVFVEENGRITGKNNFIGGYASGNRRALLVGIIYLIEDLDLEDDVLALLKEEKRTFDSVISKAYKEINKKH